MQGLLVVGSVKTFPAAEYNLLQQLPCAFLSSCRRIPSLLYLLVGIYWHLVSVRTSTANRLEYMPSMYCPSKLIATRAPCLYSSMQWRTMVPTIFIASGVIGLNMCLVKELVPKFPRSPLKNKDVNALTITGLTNIPFALIWTWSCISDNSLQPSRLTFWWSPLGKPTHLARLERSHETSYCCWSCNGSWQLHEPAPSCATEYPQWKKP